jgi:hypothetical protein
MLSPAIAGWDTPGCDCKLVSAARFNVSAAHFIEQWLGSAVSARPSLFGKQLLHRVSQELSFER